MNRAAVRTLTLAAVCLTFFTARAGRSDDWSQWRGANRDAKTADFKTPATWPNELHKKWQLTVGDGVATPALVGDKLYVFTRQDGNEIIRCLEAATNKELWQKSYAAEGANGPASGFAGPRSSPTFADGKVITFGVRGMLTCFDAATGNQLWQKNEFPDSYPQFFTSSSPIVTDGLCITQQGGRKDGGIIAYDLATGAEKWRWMESGPAYGSPVLMDIDGTKVVIAPTDSKMVTLGTDGKLLWEIQYSQGRYNSASPIVSGTTLIIAGPGTGMTAFKMKKDGDKLVEEELWKNVETSVGFNTPVLKDKLLFGLSNADQLFCFDTQSQKTAWSSALAKPIAENAAAKEGVGQSRRSVPATLVQFVQQENRDRPEDRDRPNDRRGADGERRRGDRPGGPGGGRRGGGRGRSGYGSIVDVGSALIALSPAGELVVYKPASEGFSELARYKVAESGTYAYPIPSGHGIYAKDQNDLTLWSVE